MLPWGCCLEQDNGPHKEISLIVMAKVHWLLSLSRLFTYTISFSVPAPLWDIFILLLLPREQVWRVRRDSQSYSYNVTHKQSRTWTQVCLASRSVLSTSALDCLPQILLILKSSPRHFFVRCPLFPGMDDRKCGNLFWKGIPCLEKRQSST